MGRPEWSATPTENLASLPARTARRRSWFVVDGLVIALAIVGLVVLLTRSTGPAKVEPAVLPVAGSARVGRTLIDCSPTTEIGYIPNRPCDTYFLVTARGYSSAASLLVAEQRQLVRAEWRHVPRATSWGFGPATDGWIGPDHSGCAIVATATDGSRAMANFERGIAEPGYLTGFVRASRAAGPTSTLYVLLQPGENQGRARC